MFLCNGYVTGVWPKEGRNLNQPLYVGENTKNDTIPRYIVVLFLAFYVTGGGGSGGLESPAMLHKLLSPIKRMRYKNP